VKRGRKEERRRKKRKKEKGKRKKEKGKRKKEKRKEKEKGVSKHHFDIEGDIRLNHVTLLAVELY